MTQPKKSPKQAGAAAIKAVLATLQDPALSKALVALSVDDKRRLLQAMTDALNGAATIPDWTPAETWRSIDKKETATAFLERVYLATPYQERPYTHQLQDKTSGDPALYAAAIMLIAQNRRRGRTGPQGSLLAARTLSDLFPAYTTRTIRATKRLETADVKVFIRAIRAKSPVKAPRKPRSGAPKKPPRGPAA